MNNERRKRIRLAMENINAAKKILEGAAEEINSIMEEEQEAYDNLPEGLQCSERGCNIEECIGYLDEAVSQFDEVDLDEILDCLEDCL